MTIFVFNLIHGSVYKALKGIFALGWLGTFFVNPVVGIIFIVIEIMIPKF